MILGSAEPIQTIRSVPIVSAVTIKRLEAELTVIPVLSSRPASANCDVWICPAGVSFVHHCRIPPSRYSQALSQLLGQAPGLQSHAVLAAGFSAHLLRFAAAVPDVTDFAGTAHFRRSRDELSDACQLAQVVHFRTRSVEGPKQRVAIAQPFRGHRPLHVFHGLSAGDEWLSAGPTPNTQRSP